MTVHAYGSVRATALDSGLQEILRDRQRRLSQGKGQLLLVGPAKNAGKSSDVVLPQQEQVPVAEIEALLYDELLPVKRFVCTRVYACSTINIVYTQVQPLSGRDGNRDTLF